MKERPIIFSGPMVRAILDGRKTQTRRIVSKQNSMTSCPFGWHDLDSPQTFVDHGFPDKDGKYLGGYLHAPISNGPPGHDKTAIFRIYPRYAAAGQWDEEPASDYCPPPTRLWVRETWIQLNVRGKTTEGWPVLYRADTHPLNDWRWKPSIHMPCWASRITLGIEAVRAERLQDISAHDAVLEGVYVCASQDPTDIADEALDNFHNSWDSIHGEGAWDENPWVWVIEFKVIS